MFPQGPEDILCRHAPDAGEGRCLVDGDRRDGKAGCLEDPPPDIPDVAPHGEVGEGIRAVLFGEGSLLHLPVRVDLQGRSSDVHVHLCPESPPDSKGPLPPPHDDDLPPGNTVKEQTLFDPLGPGN